MVATALQGRSPPSDVQGSPLSLPPRVDLAIPAPPTKMRRRTRYPVSTRCPTPDRWPLEPSQSLPAFPSSDPPPGVRHSPPPAQNRGGGCVHFHAFTSFVGCRSQAKTTPIAPRSMLILTFSGSRSARCAPREGEGGFLISRARHAPPSRETTT